MLCYEFISHSFWQAKQAYRSHSFPCMNRDQRRLIHELAECYGCETQSYDYEPSKNVVATAHKYAVFLLYTGKGPHMIFMHVTFCLKIVRKFCVKITLRFCMKFMHVTFRLFLMQRIRMKFMQISNKIHVSLFCLCSNFVTDYN